MIRMLIRSIRIRSSTTSSTNRRTDKKEKKRKENTSPPPGLHEGSERARAADSVVVLVFSVFVFAAFAFVVEL